MSCPLCSSIYVAATPSFSVFLHFSFLYYCSLHNEWCLQYDSVMKKISLLNLQELFWRDHSWLLVFLGGEWSWEGNLNWNRKGGIETVTLRAMEPLKQGNIIGRSTVYNCRVFTFMRINFETDFNESVIFHLHIFSNTAISLNYRKKMLNCRNMLTTN